VKVRITARAQLQVRGRKVWWAENRPAAPALFEEELVRTLRLISEQPEAGVRWPTAKNPRLRRVLMTETHHHVYFQVDQPGNTVVVLTVWGAQRGRGPSL